MDPISIIPNLGPASDALYRRAGIASADELRALGADAAYAKLLRAGTNPHFIGYYALVMGLQGRPWTDCQGDEKAALRVRFDEIKAAAKPSPETQASTDLDKFMNDIGLVCTKPAAKAK
ncbi:MAG: TfoX/Sxy family protein [Rhodobacteraceae bacterium]|nr:TfoX/Sxy family protein [Paracoccaceae bacterium]